MCFLCCWTSQRARVTLPWTLLGAYWLKLQMFLLQLSTAHELVIWTSKCDNIFCTTTKLLSILYRLVQDVLKTSIQHRQAKPITLVQCLTNLTGANAFNIQVAPSIKQFKFLQSSVKWDSLQVMPAVLQPYLSNVTWKTA